MKMCDKKASRRRLNPAATGALAGAGVAALLLAGCATTTAATAVVGAQLTADAYCALTPEARAEFRRKLGLRVPLLNCAQPIPPSDLSSINLGSLVQ